MPFAHQVGPQLRKLSFPELREAVKQRLARNESENRVSQKFELFVVTHPCSLGRLERFPLARLGGVGQRLFEQFRANESILESFLQQSDVPWFHVIGALRPRQHPWSTPLPSLRNETNTGS